MNAPGPIQSDPPDAAASFHDRFVELFEAQFHRLFRLLDRLSGDPDLAGDLAQEALVRLHRRGTLPDAPSAWLVSVALNLLRNARATEGRRRRLLTPTRGEWAHSDPPVSAEETVLSDERRRRVRATLDRIPERERHLLLLQAEGYGYRDIAAALGLNEASIGTLLARARRAFREGFGEADDAS